MDARDQIETGGTSRIDFNLRCDGCGYPRMGLPVSSRCPECGALPPTIARAGDHYPVTAGESVWLGSVAAGLILLTLATINSISVAMEMPLYESSLLGIGVPAPRLWSILLLERSVGGRPGPLGVNAIVTVMVSVLGVWLITRPRFSHANEAQLLSLRTMTRWAAILLLGGLFGVALSMNALYGSELKIYISLTTLFCDLPINTLFFAYLHRLSRQLGSGGTSLLKTTAILYPICLLGSLAVVAVQDFAPGGPMLFRLLAVGQGALCMTGGVLGTFGVATLVATVIRRAWPWSIAQLRRVSHRMLAAIRRTRRVIALPPDRAALAAGIAFWLLIGPAMVGEASWYSSRRGVGGDLPFMNVPFTKVMLAPAALSYRDQGDYSESKSKSAPFMLFLQMLSIWLMTTKPAEETPRQALLRRWARWTATIASGLAMGWILQWHAAWYADSNLRIPLRSESMLFIAFFFESPATVLLFLHLASRARQFGFQSAATQLRRFAIAVPMLILIPSLFFFFAAFPSLRRHPTDFALLGGVIMAVELAAALLAIQALASVAFRLVTTSLTRPERRKPPVRATGAAMNEPPIASSHQILM